MQLFATFGLVALGLGLSLLVREFDLSVSQHGRARRLHRGDDRRRASLLELSCSGSAPAC